MADENEEVRLCDLTETREEFYDDDVVVVDSKLHNTAKMPAKDRLPQNVLADRIAEPFDDSRTDGNPYKVGEEVMYNGKHYFCKIPHYGPWNGNHFVQKPLSEFKISSLPFLYDSWVRNVENLDDVTPNSVTPIIKTDNTTTTNFPADYGNGNGILLCVKGDLPDTNYQISQILYKFSTGECWTRRWNTYFNSWSDWDKQELYTDIYTLVLSLAPNFDPTRTSENPYKVGELVTKDFKLYVCSANKYGAWDGLYFSEITASSLIDNLLDTTGTSSLNVFGKKFARTIKFVKSHWTNIVSLFVVKGATYRFAVDFNSHSLAKTFNLCGFCDGVEKMTHATGLTLTKDSFSWTSDYSGRLDLIYYCGADDVPDFGFEVSLFSGGADKVHYINESLLDISTNGGSFSESFDVNEYNKDVVFAKVHLSKGIVYKVRTDLSVAPNSGVAIRVRDTNDNIVFQYSVPTGWNYGENSFSVTDDGVYTIGYRTGAANVTTLTLTLSSDGSVGKINNHNSVIDAAYHNSIPVLLKSDSISTTNTIVYVPCKIKSGRTYRCIITTDAANSRYGYGYDSTFKWLVPLQTSKLNGYEFSFTADRDAECFGIYNTTACGYDIKVYEAARNICPSAVTHNNYAIYQGDTKTLASPYICNAVSLKDGTIIAARSNGVIVKIALDGTETQLLDFGVAAHCRCMFFDSNGNLYLSPSYFGHDTFSSAGIYKMAKGESTFTKVLSLYDADDRTDSTIWTMSEDSVGNLYAGEYSVAKYNPIVWKSTDGGDTWSELYDFTELAPEGRHIHWVEYSPWQDALYAIVGEVNTIFKSTDGGENWIDLQIALPDGKGCGAITTPNGILLGSDSARELAFYLIDRDDSTYRLINKFWANMCFAMRRNNLNGDIFAFGVIDVSNRDSRYYPPYSVLSLPDPMTGVETWHAELVTTYGQQLGDQYYNSWLAYYNRNKDKYPEDAIVPQHYGLFVSRDGGLSFELVLKVQASTAIGFNAPGQFYNGECLCGVSQGDEKPVVISSGKQKFVQGGCDFDGQIFVRTNSSSVNQLM